MTARSPLLYTSSLSMSNAGVKTLDDSSSSKATYGASTPQHLKASLGFGTYTPQKMKTKKAKMPVKFDDGEDCVVELEAHEEDPNQLWFSVSHHLSLNKQVLFA